MLCGNLIINYFGKVFFPIKRKQGINNCSKHIISSVFTTVASRLKSEQKEKEKEILKLNATFTNQVTLYKRNENFTFLSNN